MLTGNLIILLASAASLVKSRRTDDANMASNPNQYGAQTDSNAVYSVQDFSTEQMNHIANIVESLESLDILDSRPSMCLSLQQIRVSRRSDNTGAIQVGFELQIQEWTDTSDEHVNNNLEPGSIRRAGDCFATEIDSAVGEENNGTENITIVIMPPSSVGSSKQPHGTPEHSNAKKTPVESTKKRLSYTQMVVMTTCSVVIGVFFLIAISMRIRSYLKRTREEEAIARRPTFRSCSVALRNAQERKDSEAKGSFHETESVQLNIGNGLRQPLPESPPGRCEPDVRPLLMISRSPSLPLSPSVSSQRSQEETGNGYAIPYERNQHAAAYRRYSAASDIVKATPPSPNLPPKVIVEDTDRCLEGKGAPNLAYQNSPCEEHCSKDIADAAQAQERLLDFRENTLHRNPPTAKNAGSSDDQDGNAHVVDKSRPPSENKDPDSEITLTQSDSSISAENPSYRYGNQIEYTDPTYAPGRVPDSPDEVYRPAAQINRPTFHVENEEKAWTNPPTNSRVECSKPLSLPIVKLDLAPDPSEAAPTQYSNALDSELSREGDASDEELTDSESDKTVLLAEAASGPSSPRDTLKVYDERSFLLGPEFEGMEPTYV